MNIEDIKSFSEAVREILHLDYYNAGAKNKLIIVKEDNMEVVT